MAPGVESGFPTEDVAEHIVRVDSVEPAPTDAQPPTPPPLARLVFHVLTDCTVVFAVTPDGTVRGHVVKWGRDMLSERIAQLRQALDVDDTPRGVRLARHLVPTTGSTDATDPKPLLRELYSKLIAPVAEALPDDGTPVVIEPHAALWLLPFAVLLTTDDTWLADQWPLLYSPSAHVLDEIRQEPDYGGPGDLKALIVGNPLIPAVPSQDDLEIKLQPLPGAEEEARTISDFFPGRCTLLLGTDADRATVETLAEKHGILHLATHGIAYADDPLASFVALAKSQHGDGLLTARETLFLSLPADLVALSACQTGLGRVSGDGMIGLSRAFLVAGARAVLVSQWNISDEATAALMTAFYRGYLEWDNKAFALQYAMQSLHANSEYEPPRYWAPFVVIGAEA
jgi:CHAT domain-containing protein